MYIVSYFVPLYLMSVSYFLDTIFFTTFVILAFILALYIIGLLLLFYLFAFTCESCAFIILLSLVTALSFLLKELPFNIFVSLFQQR